MTVYSKDEVDYSCNEIHDLICDWLGSGEVKAGEVVEIYEAEINPLDTKGELINCRELKVRLLDDSGDYEILPEIAE